MVMLAYRKKLHMGIASAMAKVRSLIWIRVLRKLTKFVIQNVYGCKGFRATHYWNPKQS